MAVYTRNPIEKWFPEYIYYNKNDSKSLALKKQFGSVSLLESRCLSNPIKKQPPDTLSNNKGLVNQTFVYSNCSPSEWYM